VVAVWRLFVVVGLLHAMINSVADGASSSCASGTYGSGSGSCFINPPGLAVVLLCYSLIT
jgi:hypothetical protein